MLRMISTALWKSCKPWSKPGMGLVNFQNSDTRTASPKLKRSNRDFFRIANVNLVRHGKHLRAFFLTVRAVTLYGREHD
jgi:hypothetical protein